MKKRKILSKSFSVLLAVLMLLSVIPLTAFAKYNNEYYAAANTNYISQVAMYNSSSSNDDAKNNLRNKGWTPIGANFNSGDAHDSNFVHMGAKYSTNAAEAIRAFRIYKGQGAPNSITSWINGYNVTFYKVGSGAHDCVPSVLSGSVDLNAGGGGDYLYIYATRDPNAGPPVTAYTMTVDSDQYLSGWYHVTSFHDTGTPYDANSGQGSKSAFLWCHWKSSATGVSTTNLRTAYTNSASYETSTNYTEASRAVLKTARTNASTCYTAFDNNGGVAAYTQTQINAYQTAITTALNNLQTNVYLKATTNGGTPDKDTTVTIGTKSSVEFDVSEYAATKNYYNFVGWNTDKDATTGSASSVTVGMNTPVYAIFSAELKDTFCYLTSDGENTSEEKTVTVYNNTDSAEVTAPVEIGSFVTYGGKTYTLVGWRSDTAAAAPMNASNTYTHSVATPEATHYAVYRNDITVEYNKNGGETDMPSETKPQYLTASSEMNISNPSFTLAADPTRVGHTFAGWYTDSECSDENKAGDAGETYTANENTTLYAKWNINSYTVIFANYDGEAVKTESVKYGEKATAPAENPAKPYDETYHYVFSGWNGFTAETVVTEDVTYTAEYTSVAHTYSSEVTTPSTCVKHGTTTYTCACGYSYTANDVEFADHTRGDAVKENEVAATCTEDGSYDEVVYCTVCGEELSRESKTVEATGHDFTNAVNDKKYLAEEATCGMSPLYYVSCTNCGESSRGTDKENKFTYGEPLGHNLEHHDANNATCTENGNIEYYTCTRCKEIFKDAEGKEAISSEDTVKKANGHTEVIDAAKPATCTETGLTEGKHCSVCDEVLVKQETVSALTHDWGEWTVTTAPTCTALGVETRVCKNDASHTETRSIEKAAHVYSAFVETVTKATCKATGTDKYKCATCDETKTVETPVDGTNHVETVLVNVKEATCAEEGYTGDKQCTACGVTVERGAATEKKDHVLIHHDAKAATCTAVGWNAYDECENCEYSTYEALPVDSDAHDWGEWDVTTVPTCTVGGEETRICNRDESHVEVHAIDAFGHDFTKEVIDDAHLASAATCTAKAVYKYGCTKCDEIGTETFEYSNALGHDFELVSETPATCTADGEKSYKCTRCDETKTEKLPANGHSWGEWVTVKEPTATEKGLAKRTCSACTAEEEKPLEYVSEKNRTIQFVNIDRMHYVLDNDGEDYIVYNSGAVKWYTDKPLNFTVYTYSNFKYQTVIVKVDGVEISPNADGVYTVPAGESLAVVTVEGAVENSDGTKLSFWEMIVRFFKKIFSAIAGLFGGSSGSKS